MIKLKSLIEENLGVEDVIDFFNRYKKETSKTAYYLLKNPEIVNELDKEKLKKVLAWIQNNQMYLDGSVMRIYDTVIHRKY